MGIPIMNLKKLDLAWAGIRFKDDQTLENLLIRNGSWFHLILTADQFLYYHPSG